MNAEELSFYYEKMVAAGLSELEIETPSGKIVLKRKTQESVFGGQPPLLRRKSDFAPSLPQGSEVPSVVITSPLMGTFYRSSSPQSPPFVKEGDVVDAGVTLCIVEAMKVMNEIKSERRCKIIKILAENGKAVTKGQPLFSTEVL